LKLNADVAAAKLHFYIDIVKTRPLVVFLLYVGFLVGGATGHPPADWSLQEGVKDRFWVH